MQLHPSRVEAHATLAKTYADKNQNDKALAEWAIATSRSSTEHADWDFAYGRLLFEHGTPKDALLHLLTASKLAEKMEPSPVWMPTAEFMTAEVLHKQGNKQDAKEHYIYYLDRSEPSAPDRRDAKRALQSIDPEWHER